MIGPEQPAEVMREAGQRAVRMRRIRAEIKRRLKDGDSSLEDVIGGGATPERIRKWFPSQVDASEIDNALARMRAVDLLTALPRYGNARAEKLMLEVSISPRRRVGGLGSRQRQALITAAKRFPKSS